MSKEKLKPCPFCGGKKIDINPNTFKDRWEIGCEICWAGVDRKDRKVAIKAWNRRTK